MENSFRLGARKMIAAAAGVALAASLCAAPVSAYADESTSSSATEQALAKVNDLMSQIDSANDDYQSALADKAAAEQKVKEAKQTIKTETANIDKNQNKLSDRMRSMYRDGQTSFVEVLLGSATFDSFIQNWDLLSDMNQNDADLISSLKTSRAKLQAAQVEAQENADTAAQKASDAKQRRDQANELAKQAQAEYKAAYQAAQQQAVKKAAAKAGAAGGTQGGTATEAQTVKQVTAAGNVSKDTANQTTVSQNDITNFDQNTGEVTLTDGSKARVVGYDSKTGNAIVDTAMQYVGGKYVYGAEDAANSTFDCSGLVQYVYSKNGITVGGHNDRAILNGGSVVSNPQAGDICWWDGHVAIYAGNGKMISADNEKNGITYRNVDSGVTYVRYK